MAEARTRMLPVSRMDAGICQELRAVFSDLDDTLTSDGRLADDAYSAIWRLVRAGVSVVVVTGRPAGWADCMMRLWPVAGVIAENGACIFRLDAGGRAVRWYAQDEPSRQANIEALRRMGADLLARFPGLRLAADQAFRETDLAIDISEEADGLDPETLHDVRRVLDANGLTYKMSSIHLNAWLGNHDKASTCARFIRDVLCEEPGTERHLFIGDSPNDEPLFRAFPLSVGVRNIERFAADMTSPPRFVTGAEGGAGFVELAARLIACRSLSRVL